MARLGRSRPAKAYVWVRPSAPSPLFTGAAAMSGTGHLTALGGLTYAETATLSGTGTLTATGSIAGFFFPVATLTGTGTLTGTRAREGFAALAGTGILAAGTFVLGYSAYLTGTGVLGVARVLGVITAGASRGLVTRPYAWPGSSQVAVSAPGSSRLMWLGSLGQVTALKYSFICPGGADKMNTTVMVPATYRTQLFNPGWTVRIFRGGHQIWSGKLDEPVATTSGWNLTAVGTGNRGQDFLAIYSSTWPAGEPDESINNAISRGMPWANPGVGTPAGAWFGQAVDSGAQTIAALLGLVCTRGGLTWYVNSQPGGIPGDDISVFPLPSVVNRLLVVTNPVARTLGGDINTIYLRYEVTAADTSSGGSGTATYATTSVQNAQSVAQHGVIETYIDISDVGVQTAAQAQAMGSMVLQVYQRASFAGPFSGSYGHLLNAGGQPIDPGTDQAGTFCKAILTDFGFGGEVVPGQPVTFITGAYEWDDFAQVFTVTPYQSADQSLTGLLSQAHTAAMQPVTAASGG